MSFAAGVFDNPTVSVGLSSALVSVYHFKSSLAFIQNELSAAASSSSCPSLLLISTAGGSLYACTLQICVHCQNCMSRTVLQNLRKGFVEDPRIKNLAIRNGIALLVESKNLELHFVLRV